MYCAKCEFCGMEFKGITLEEVKSYLKTHIYENHAEEFKKDREDMLKATSKLKDPLKWAIGSYVAYLNYDCSSEDPED